MGSDFFLPIIQGFKDNQCLTCRFRGVESELHIHGPFRAFRCKGQLRSHGFPVNLQCFPGFLIHQNAFECQFLSRLDIGIGYGINECYLFICVSHLKAGFGIFHLSTDFREEDGLVLILDIGVNSHFQVILPQFLEADHGGSAKARSVKGKFYFHAAGRFFRRKGRLCRYRFSINLKGFPGFFVHERADYPILHTFFQPFILNRVNNRYLVIGLCHMGAAFFIQCSGGNLHLVIGQRSQVDGNRVTVHFYIKGKKVSAFIGFTALFFDGVSIIDQGAFGVIRLGGAKPDAVFRSLTPVGIGGMFVPLCGCAGITVFICYDGMAFAGCFGRNGKRYACETGQIPVTDFHKLQIPTDDLVFNG